MLLQSLDSAASREQQHSTSALSTVSAHWFARVFGYRFSRRKPYREEIVVMCAVWTVARISPTQPRQKLCVGFIGWVLKRIIHSKAGPIR